MRAIILAAGRGSRLGARSDNLHKCLLEVGRRPLIEHQLEALAETGVGPVAMVVGYCANEVKEVVGIRAEYIHNPRWGATNSMYSFTLAREWIKGPVVIMNCDTMFHPEILERLLDIGGDAIAYDSGSGDAREHMKVDVSDGRLLSMSKTLDRERVAGENVGVLCLTEETTREVLRHADALMADGGEDLWLGSAICEVATQRFIRAVDIAGLPWGEIDSAFDLDNVRKTVWPAIQRSQRTRTWRWLRSLRAAAFLVMLISVLSAFAFRTATSSATVPASVTWELLSSDGSRVVEIQSDRSVQRWLLVEADGLLEMPVYGPTRVRVDTRAVLTNADDEAHYVIDVDLDDENIDWYIHSTGSSQTWKHEDFRVSKRERIEIAVPEGKHTLRISIVAAECDSCLVRVRQEVDDDS